MNEQQQVKVDHEVVVIGAGITGIYQLHRLREAGFSVRVLEAGGGVGGTWFWNRYPAARFDSESYSYGYFFSKELLAEWTWKEHFAGQPEIEEYLNHVVDRFGHREHIQVNAYVEGMTFDPDTSSWSIRVRGGDVVTARFVVAATGILSVPFHPDIDGKADFRGEAYHTGEWPQEPVDFAGKRVAVVGNGSSGVQIIPAIADRVESLTVYQRTANWCAPLNNSAIGSDEHVDIRARYDQLYARCNQTFFGFLHDALPVNTFDVSEEERLAHYEDVWSDRGHSALCGNFADTMSNPDANAEFSRFLAGKIRSLVDDPDTAEKLIPKDHGFGMKRPPLVNGYYETFNLPHVELVDLRATPIVRVVETGIETSDALREHDMIIWATGFDAVTGALTRMNIEGRGGAVLRETWADGPRTFLGIASPGFPNLLFAGGPQGTGGNIPRSTEIHVDFVTRFLVHAREHGIVQLEAESDAAEAWTEHVNEGVGKMLVAESNWTWGSNIPGKPKQPLMYRSGLPVYRQKLRDVEELDYRGFRVTTAATVDPATAGR